MPSDHPWIRIYRETLEPLYGYLSRRVGGDRNLAEDITQETWLRALKHWRANGLPDQPLAWLKTVARNLISNYYRRRQPVELSSAALEEAISEHRDRGPDSPEAAALVHWCLERLRPEQGKLIEAFHLDGLTLRDIADETGLSERAVEGRLHRARRALGELLESPEKME